MIDEAAAVAAEEDKPIEIDLADIDAADESEMVVTNNGKLTTWVWTFAGPGHPNPMEIRRAAGALCASREIRL